MDKCNHKSKIQSAGFVVCSECGLCIEIIHALDNRFSEKDHRILNPKASTMLGFTHERRGIYHRIAKPIYIGKHRDHKLDILSLLKGLLAFLECGPDLYRAIYPYMLKLHNIVKPRTNLRGIKLFVPCATYVCLKDLGITVYINKLSALTGIKTKKLQRGIEKLNGYRNSNMGYSGIGSDT